MPFHVSTLREQPQHLPAVAAWIHRQWWSQTDTPVSAIERWLGTHLGEGGFPSTFVVICEGEPVASVSLHETEAEDRPACRPYLGALFVRPDQRGRGLGAVLVRSVEEYAVRLGHSAIYLNAAGGVTAFYEALGWWVIERGYGPKKLNIMRRDL